MEHATPRLERWVSYLDANLQDINLGKNSVVKKSHDLELCALIVLPDHVYMLITLAENSDDYAVIVANIKTHFSRQIPKLENEVISHSRSRKWEWGIWQRRFWQHKIRDDLDYRRHMDYIRYNAVKHGYVARPIDWLYSTFKKCVEMGIYNPD